ncbi:sialic acid-specific 9-O-acetylesterase [Algibacter lectus]|uniref:Sialic acid-specific 9-O-acetylesterase n=1 Tax=Algibacter lectus TaxID=221126 RepID=A0A090WS28_9FLAO|nr:hypothetical protein [Algibacter lectus]GAL79915.1 sialic acid-specific 9-O-acetylesterase [Algibacter lectus]
MKLKKHLFIPFLLLAFFQFTISFSQELKPASLFSDGMVLQRDIPVPVWGGTAKPNSKITVTFANQKQKTKADNNGKWMLKLDPLKASKIARDLVISGDSKVIISNILVGEVWICSGQSNMQFNVNNVPEIKSLIPFTKNIRTFQVKNIVSLEEQDEVTGTWKVTNPSSAVAFGFAYFLESIGDVPVGIILSSWGKFFSRSMDAKKHDRRITVF